MRNGRAGGDDAWHVFTTHVVHAATYRSDIQLRKILVKKLHCYTQGGITTVEQLWSLLRYTLKSSLALHSGIGSHLPHSKGTQKNATRSVATAAPTSTL